MQVQARKTPADIDPVVAARITADVTAALQSITTVEGRFVVNPTVWFGRKRSSQEVSVQVVNSASFLSKGFQSFLTTRGWDTEKLLSGQRIDAYVEMPSAPGFQLSRQQLGTFIDQFTAAHPESSIDSIVYRYIKRSCFNLALIDPAFHGYFTQTSASINIRIGLEFETGNIASSFRSLNKLNYLFRKGDIDAGVFITSLDKATTAAQIWPASNRNGSFTELEQRNYGETISFPIWEFSFAPDALNTAAPYLANAAGKTYMP